MKYPRKMSAAIHADNIAASLETFLRTSTILKRNEILKDINFTGPKDENGILWVDFIIDKEVEKSQSNL